MRRTVTVRPVGPGEIARSENGVNDGERGVPRIPMARNASGVRVVVPAQRTAAAAVRVPRPRGVR